MKFIPNNTEKQMNIIQNLPKKKNSLIPLNTYKKFENYNITHTNLQITY